MLTEMSADFWAFAVQVLGLVIAFCLGLRIQLKSLTAMAATVGILAAIIGPLLIGGGGPGAFAAFFVLPVCYIIAAHLAYGLRTAWRWSSRRDSRSGGRVD